MESPVPQQALTGLNELPESCISKILSFNTPRDASTLSPVSKLFRRAVLCNFNTDSYWKAWLPKYYSQILSTAISPIEWSSMKDLYFRLCRPILLAGKTKMFWLNRDSTKICYAISARELSLIWGEEGRHWFWRRLDPSYVAKTLRFEEAAELRGGQYLQAWGRFDCKLLSPNTEYSLSFLVKFDSHHKGWNELPVHFIVTTAGEERREVSRVLVKKKAVSGTNPNLKVDTFKCRDDGWMEVVAGEFKTKTYSDGDGPELLRFGIEELLSSMMKRGLLLGGVMIEPKT